MSKEYTNELLLDFGQDGKELIPVITQDYNTKEVLILAFASKEAFEETLKSGYATYFSRTRKQLWKKGLAINWSLYKYVNVIVLYNNNNQHKNINFYFGTI